MSMTLFTGGREARRTIPALELSPYLTSVQAGSLQRCLSSPAVSHAKTITINPLSPSQQDLSLPEPQRPIQNRPMAAEKIWSGTVRSFKTTYIWLPIKTQLSAIYSSCQILQSDSESHLNSY